MFDETHKELVKNWRKKKIKNVKCILTILVSLIFYGKNSPFIFHSRVKSVFIRNFFSQTIAIALNIMMFQEIT